MCNELTLKNRDMKKYFQYSFAPTSLIGVSARGYGNAMKQWGLIFSLALVFQIFYATEISARRTHLTPDQKTQLAQANVVLVNVLALTENGQMSSSSLQEVIIRRLREMHYTVTTDRTQTYDVVFKVKCEERKTWTGTTPEGGDAELIDTPARLWKGPACLLTYLLEGQNLGWYREVRTEFEDSIEAARNANVSDSGLYAIQQLAIKLAEYDFPVLVTAEWRQINRLLQVLDSSNTSRLRKLKILSMMDELQASEALPYLTEIMKEKDLAEEAIVALAGVGRNSISLIIDLFTTSKQPGIQAAAAKALGEVAASTGDPRTIPPLVRYVENSLKTMNTSADINFPVLTQVVWAIGKLRDEISMTPMSKLNEKVWLIYDTTQEMADLREATSWTWKQLDLDAMAT